MLEMPWYKSVEKSLLPFQGLVVLSLVFIIAFTIYVIGKGDNVARTGWLVYLISP